MGVLNVLIKSQNVKRRKFSGVFFAFLLKQPNQLENELYYSNTINCCGGIFTGRISSWCFCIRICNSYYCGPCTCDFKPDCKAYFGIAYTPGYHYNPGIIPACHQCYYYFTGRCFYSWFWSRWILDRFAF